MADEKEPLTKEEMLEKLKKPLPDMGDLSEWDFQ